MQCLERLIPHSLGGPSCCISYYFRGWFQLPMVNRHLLKIPSADAIWGSELHLRPTNSGFIVHDRQEPAGWGRNGMAFAMPSLALPYLPWYARGGQCPRRRGSLSGPESSYLYSPRPVMDGGVPRLHCKAHHAFIPFIPFPVAQTQNGRKMVQ